MRYALLLLALSFIVTPLAHAQRTISYRLTIFGQGSVENKTYTNRPGNGDKVKAIKGFVNDPVRAPLRDNLYLDFYESSRRATGDEILKPDFSVAVPEGTPNNSLILLLQEDKKIKAKVIDFNKLNIRNGDQWVINSLPVKLAFRFSNGEGKKWGKPIIFKPGAQGRVAASNEDSVMREVLYQNPKTKKFGVIYRGIYLKEKGGRELVFCYKKKGQRIPEIETVFVHNFVNSRRPS